MRTPSILEHIVYQNTFILYVYLYYMFALLYVYSQLLHVFFAICVFYTVCVSLLHVFFPVCAQLLHDVPYYMCVSYWMCIVIARVLYYMCIVNTCVFTICVQLLHVYRYYMCLYYMCIVTTCVSLLHVWVTHLRRNRHDACSLHTRTQRHFYLRTHAASDLILHATPFYIDYSICIYILTTIFIRPHSISQSIRDHILHQNTFCKRTRSILTHSIMCGTGAGCITV